MVTFLFHVFDMLALKVGRMCLLALPCLSVCNNLENFSLNLVLGNYSKIY
jgi:hypothetical protein